VGFTVWDFDSGNAIGSFATREEAEALVDELSAYANPESLYIDEDTHDPLPAM
jgi:hypothetical protein